MGLFDGWINGLLYATGIKKKKPKKYFDTNEKNFLEIIPSGRAFVFLTSMRKLNPWKDGFNKDDFFRGGIQGVGGKHSSEGGSYWIHAGIGYKKNSKVEIIESLDKITRRELNVYFKPINQLKLFFPPLTKQESLEVWNRALSKEGSNYDYLDILGHISVMERLFKFKWGDPKLFVCGCFSRWVFRKKYDIMDPSIPDQRGAPKDINEWLQPDLNTKLMVYNMNPRQHN